MLCSFVPWEGAWYHPINSTAAECDVTSTTDIGSKHAQWIVGLALLAAGLLALALYLYYGAQATGNFGFPLDDSWIHMQIARNLAGGQGWSFNPGEPTGASTAPLWVVLLALAHLAAPADPATAAKVLGSLLYLATVLLIALLAWRVSEDGRVAFVAGLLAAWQPVFVWGALSGMETPLYLMLVLLGLVSLLAAEQRGAAAAYGATAWLTLAGWARPEVWALLPVAWLYLYWRRRELDAGRFWLHGLIALAGVGAFVAFNLAVWGQPLPATWYAKLAFFRGGQTFGAASRLMRYASRFLSNIQAAVYSQNPALVVMLAAGCLAAWRSGGARWRRAAMLLGVVIASIAAAAYIDLGSVAFQSYRRAAHLVAALNVLTAIGALAVWDVLARGLPVPFTRPVEPGDGPPAGSQRGRVVVSLALVLLALAMQVTGLRMGGQLYANDMRSINQGNVDAARWLAANTPPDAVVAVNDIGALAYFGQRRIVDLLGLATPEAIEALSASRRSSLLREQRLLALMVDEGVRYVVIFPELFPNLVQDPALVELARFFVPEATALAHDLVAAYRLDAP